MKKPVIFLVISLIVFAIGISLNFFYETTGVEIEVTVSDVETKDDTGRGPISYTHTIYGDYTYNGRSYHHVKVDTRYNSSSSSGVLIGERMTVIINPEDPDHRISDGSFLAFTGFIATIISTVFVVKARKKQKLQQMNSLLDAVDPAVGEET